ncbi:MAG: SAM-dependent methyltransferase [Verrucomicrobiales bacterium]|nr:SAM-dependent methyltransferase [Verrucomicrobiales bacterium]
MELDQIVPWGRTRREYELMFALAGEDLSPGVLDCGAGPASFVAELAAEGVPAVACDPIYAYAGKDIRTRFDATCASILAQVRATPDRWVWGYHRDPDGLLRHRRAALEGFLADYDHGKRAGRYLVAGLPELPFGARRFRFAVCSHLLFLYSEQLSAGFHVRSIRELCRVADEVRVFPLLNLAGEPSPHLEAVRRTLAEDGWKSDVVRVDYELQRGGNEMLRLFRA